VPPLVDVVRAARCRGQLGYALVTLAGTGLRASELAGLRLDDLDLLRRTVLVRGQVLLDPQTRRPYYETPKSPDGEREIPLPAFVVDGLAAWLAKRPARTIMLPVGEPDADELVELPLVFTAERGDGPTTQESLTASTASRSRRIGAEPFSPHSLRHRYTTRSCTTPECRSGPSIT
jgi:integrase